MKRPTYHKIIDLLDMTFGYTGLVMYNQRYEEKVYEVWDKVCTEDTHPSRVWAPMVQAWVDAGVHGSHVYYASNDTHLTLDRLVDKPEEFAVRCRLRGHKCPAINYPYRLDEGPAWKAVIERQKEWHTHAYVAVSVADGVPVRTGSPLAITY